VRKTTLGRTWKNSKMVVGAERFELPTYAL
jgi:hypothetical protein